MKVLNLFFLLVVNTLVMNVHAQGDPTIPDITLTWDAPTQREDGSDLPLSEIDGYKLYHSVDGGTEEITNVPSSTNSYVFVDVVYGLHTFSISTIAQGLEGNKSAGFQTTVIEVVEPKSPVMVRIIKEVCLSVNNCSQTILFEGNN